MGKKKKKAYEAAGTLSPFSILEIGFRFLGRFLDQRMEQHWVVPAFPHAVAFAVSFKGFCHKWRFLRWLQTFRDI